MKIFKCQGIGKKLHAEVKERIGKNFWLYSWIENESNNFYKAMGFIQISQLDFEFSGHSEFRAMFTNQLVHNKAIPPDCLRQRVNAALAASVHHLWA